MSDKLGIRHLGYLFFIMLLGAVLSSITCKTKPVGTAYTEQDLFQNGYKLFSKKDYRGAILVFSGIIDNNPENAEALAYRGFCKHHLEDYEGAIIDFNRALINQPNYAEVFNWRGLSKGELGDREGACEDWKRAYELGFKGSFRLVRKFCIEK